MGSSNQYVKYLILTLSLISSATAFGQISKEKNDSTYRVGYREYKTTDSSRRYKPGAAPGNRLYYRPEEMDVWYPAHVGTDDKPLAFFYFLSLFERRANSFQDSVKYQGLAKELLQHFTIGNMSPGAALKTKSFLDATAVKGDFPLIVYLSSYNGMSYENVPLFENLASHGYVVVSISSVGRYPGNMSTRYPDILEQVRDAEFAMRFWGNKGLDTSKIGLVGYSYGGIAAALISMRHLTVKAMLSLDGSETHYYGRDKNEDKDFDELRNSIYWKPSSIKASYAYLESDHKQEDGLADSSYQLPPGRKYDYARITGAEHEDFSGVSVLTPKKGSSYELAERLALDYFEGTLKAKGQPFKDNLASFALTGKIALNPKIVVPKAGLVVISGTVVSAANGASLPYVSIGIPSGNCGTVSDAHGRFTLRVADTMLNHTVRISSLGYQAQSYTVKELAGALSANPLIRLSEQVNPLKEVMISAGKVRSRIIGNTSRSKFLNVGFPLKDLGSEVGVKIALGKKKVLLHKFNYTISTTRMDSCTFRLNIYALKDGLPAENLLTKNVVTAIGNKPGSYSIDLTPYRILLNGTVLVSLEWISGKATSGKGAVFFSAGMLSSSYHRKTTEADWVKFNGLGAGFNLKVVEE